MRNLAISGKACSGKDSLAKYIKTKLLSLGYKSAPVSFARKLYEVSYLWDHPEAARRDALVAFLTHRRG